MPDHAREISSVRMAYSLPFCTPRDVYKRQGQYDEKYCKWRYEDLPILPQPWQLIVPDEKKQQFEVLRALLNRPDVDLSLIHI